MLWIPVALVYGYIIVLSVWAVQVQSAAARAFHDPRDHPAGTHILEQGVHGIIAIVLSLSLAIRLVQLTLDLTPWLLVPLTLLALLPTIGAASRVRQMAVDDLYNWGIGILNKAKTAVLLLCSVAVLLDQVWRVVMLF